MNEIDMKELEKGVRAIAMDGLFWAAAQLEPIAYGLKKLRIIAIVEDAKVSVDDLEEKIQSLPGVQSTDIHAFNKV
jgi:translation elongation factor EF-1beta